MYAKALTFSNCDTLKAMNSTVSLVLNPSQIEDLKRQYKADQVPSSTAYVEAFFQVEGCSITLYTSHKALFQGPEAQSISIAYRSRFEAQAGSDEVGTGDYFGPVVVASVYVSEEAYQALNHLPITDSKQITDEQIRDMAPTILKHTQSSILVLENQKYNRVQGTHNLNAIKAKLHNQAYVHLKNKVGFLPSLCVVDQFTPEASYYRYLLGENEIVKGLHFETKAESKYFAVACASILARAKFLEVFDAMEKAYDFTFPKGASERVDQAAQAFCDRFGKERLREVAKVHFKNTERLK